MDWQCATCGMIHKATPLVPFPDPVESMRANARIAMDHLETIRTERVAVHGLHKEATAISAARVALQRIL